MWSLGFDFGSSRTKGALLDEAGAVRASFASPRAQGEDSALAAFLERIEALCPGGRVRVGLTGSDPGLRAVAGLQPLNGILAVAAGVRALHPGTHTIIEVGGQTAKFLVLAPDGALQDFATLLRGLSILRERFLTAVYAGGDDPSRRMALEAFVNQVKAHHRRQAAA